MNLYKKLFKGWECKIICSDKWNHYRLTKWILIKEYPLKEFNLCAKINYLSKKTKIKFTLNGW